MSRDDDLLRDVPEQVQRMQEILTAPSRLVVVKQRVAGPLTFAELHDRIPSLSIAGTRAALADLTAAGYVSDDSDPARQRKSSAALFTIDGERLTRDAAELLLYLSR